MDYKLAKCARCDKLFSKIVSEVCNHCQPDEDEDFHRIQDVIVRSGNLSALQVAEEAGVSLECVMRMLREGRIENIEGDESVKCGRCGKPAISATKRLCERCLVGLDREWAHALLEMRQRIRSKDESDMNDVQSAVSDKRASRKDRRGVPTLPPPPQKPGVRQGMVVRERLDRKK